MLKHIVLAVALIGGALITSGCNTVRGVGQDLESAANSVDRAT